MKNFLRLGDFDFTAVRDELARQPNLWRKSFRTTFAESPHKEIEDIVLRFPTDKNDPLENVFFNQSAEVPEAMKWIHAMMFVLRGTRLGRCMITKLEPGGQITPHRDYDPGPPNYYWNRFHGVIQSAPGIQFIAGDETVEMPANSCWWFDNNALHAVRNESDTTRLHIIADIQCSNAFRAAYTNLH